MLETIIGNIIESNGYVTNVMQEEITQTDSNYSLKGKIAPRFHNEGVNDIHILGVVVKPGEMFNASANTIPMDGTLSIVMPNGGKVIVIYNTLTKKRC